MPTRNVNLTDRLNRFVETEIRSGRYGNASEVVREGLRLMERRKQEDRAKLRWLRAAAREGIDQIDRGEGQEFRSAQQLGDYIGRIGREVIPDPARRRRSA